MVLWKQSFQMALHALLAHKLRLVLTMLGIVIGIASVVVIYSICLGGKSLVLEQLEELGPNLAVVYQGGGLVTRDDAETIQRDYPSARRYAMALYYEAKIEYGGRTKRLVIMGATPSYEAVRNVGLHEGEFFTEEDDRLARYVCVIDEETKNAFFKDKNPMGEYIKIDDLRFKIIGTTTKKTSNIFEQLANREPTIVPLRVLQKLAGRRDEAQILFLQLGSLSDVADAQERIKNILAGRYENIDNFNVFTLGDAIDIINKVTRILILISGSIAAISLFVGGIGIMNIMLVSVTERTREIGIRKAMGARTKDILIQFLIEAGMISGVGGIIGITLGAAGSYFAAKVAKWQAEISFPAMVLTFFFSVAVGMFFGLFPAQKAANLQPTEALRYE